MRIPVAQMKVTVPVTLKRRMYAELRRQDIRFQAWLRSQMEAWLHAHEITPASLAQHTVPQAEADEWVYGYEVSHRLQGGG